MSDPLVHIALFRPEIPPNTGNVGRLSIGLGARLHLIHPLGFSTDTKAVRRAGLDYWKHVDLQEHADAEAFFTWAEGRRVHVFSAKASASYTQADFQRGDVLLFGPESTGLPAEVRDRFDAWRIPLEGPVRSLNLSNAVAVVAYQAALRVDPGRFEP